jgi:hypothetical protein
MKILILGLSFFLVSLQFSYAQQGSTSNGTKPTMEGQKLIDLSNKKWLWMADKNVDSLNTLFDDKSKFVHMSGTWKKSEELDIIKTGSIWYKKADIHDVAVEVSGNTAVIWSRITLNAVVRGNVAVTEFTVTETYTKNNQNWKLLALTFSSVRDTHVIKH